MKLKIKMTLTGVLPIVIMTIIIIFTAKMEIQQAMAEQTHTQLTALGMMMEQTISKYYNGSNYNNFVVDKGVMKNGSLLIGEAQDVCDRIKAENDVDVNVLYGDTRYLTTITDASGNRIEGTKASPEVVSVVLQGGMDYFSDHVDIEGIEYFGYYRPLYNSEMFGGDGMPVGMIFTGMPAEHVHKAILNIVIIIAVIAVAVAVAAGVVIFLIASAISKRIAEGVDVLSRVADGNLNVDIPEKHMKSKDEVGLLTRSIHDLRIKFSQVVGQIVAHSEAVQESSDVLSREANDSEEAVNTVEKAVQEIATGASTQADETRSASDSVDEMGDIIQATHEEVNRLRDNADEMEKAGIEASKVLDQLQAINKQTVETIVLIAEQTNTTNESAKKIADATNLITDIAEETSLLSLNASIEAARAGEAGRGFAVVADQISKLADQSDASARQIEDIISQLMEDSRKSVETMEEVQRIMGEQSEMVSKTSEIFNEVINGIEVSREEIKNIADGATRIEDSRENMRSVVNSLSTVAEQNMASTQATSASTDQVSQSIDEINLSAQKLQFIAQELENSVSVFKL